MRKSWRSAKQEAGLSRRAFVTRSAAALLSATLPRSNAFALSTPDNNAARDLLHIIGHSHIDAAWLWPWTDSADVVLTTFRSALDRMHEFPEFCYSHSSIAHYQWVQTADPAMFAEIRERIAQGRWEVVGGWLVEPDCNLPSTESFARQCLYGKTYSRQALGTEVTIGFNPDSFGHAAGLPTILSNAGYRYYVFMRPQEHEMTLPRLFWWQGPDGSRVLTYRIYGSYDWSADHLQQAAAHAVPQGGREGAFFLGVGDHGGAVTRAQLAEIAAAQKDASFPQLRFSTLRAFFSAVEQSRAMQDLPVIRGELQHHARGCYSACGEEKFQNRRAERELFQTESVALVSALTYSRAYPQALLAGAWQRVLFNQFHDVLAGTSLYADYQNARDGLGYACQIALELRHADLEAMAKQVDLADVPEGAIFAYNLCPWPRKALLEFHYDANERTEHFRSLQAKDGTRTHLQLRPSDSMTNFYPRLAAWVDLPACGYTVFTLDREAAPQAPSYTLPAVVDPTAFGLKSFRADDGAELLAANLGLVVIEDTSDTWAHDIAAFRQELGRPAFISSELVEDGPVTRVTRQKLNWRSSEITVDVAVYAAVPVVELRFVIDWREHEQILKLEIPTLLTFPKVFAKVPGAALERTVNGNEEPYQDWIALEGSVHGKQYTLALLNDQTYSYDCLDGLLRTILIRSAPYARHTPNPVQDNGINAWQDQGRQERKFWLVRGQGSYADLALDRLARSLQTPAAYVLDSRHPGTQPREQSFLDIQPDTIEVLALKQAEQGTSAILRLQERAGRQTTARIHCPALGLQQQVSLAPWEIKTLALTPSLVRTTTILES